MPANLSPEYKQAEERYREAHDAEEKLAALREMLSTIPKHKGTEKLQADIKRRIANLKDEAAHQAKRRGFAIHVAREGAGQIAIAGPPSSGSPSIPRWSSTDWPRQGPSPVTASPTGWAITIATA